MDARSSAREADNWPGVNLGDPSTSSPEAMWLAATILQVKSPASKPGDRPAVTPTPTSRQLFPTSQAPSSPTVKMTKDAARHPTLLEEVARKREELAAATQELTELEATAVAAGAIHQINPNLQPTSPIVQEPALVTQSSVQEPAVAEPQLLQTAQKPAQLPTALTTAAAVLSQSAATLHLITTSTQEPAEMTTAAGPQLSQAAQEPAQLHQQPPPPAALFAPSAPTAATAGSTTPPAAQTSTQQMQPSMQLTCAGACTSYVPSSSCCCCRVSNPSNSSCRTQICARFPETPRQQPRTAGVKCAGVDRALQDEGQAPEHQAGDIWPV